MATASYTRPQISINQTPSKFSPVYAPNWFAFTASFVNTTATDPFLICDINILNQAIQAPTVSTALGRFKTPGRENNYFVFNPEAVIKSYVSYPYETGNQTYYGIGQAEYVNEQAGWGAPLNNFPTIAPETDGIVKYNMRFGLEFNPNATFSSINPVGAIGPDGVYRDYSRYKIAGTNSFANVGDIITIKTTSGLYTYYDGQAQVINAFTLTGDTYIETWQINSPTLNSLSSGNIVGQFTNIQKIYGTTSTYYGYNGTRQYDEVSVNFDNIYYFRQNGAVSPGFILSSSTASNFRFMNDYGYDMAHAIPIRPGQGERARFLCDLYADTNRLVALEVVEYNAYGGTVSTYQHILTDTISGTLYPYKCFTVQLFDKKGRFASNATTTGTPIVVGNYYKFSIKGYLTATTTQFNYASIWYKAENPCSRYENVRIKFLNRQGTWAYWNFNKDNKQTTTIERKEFKSPTQYDRRLVGPAGSVVSSTSIANPFRISKLRGQNILSITATDEFQMNSDWISEEEYEYLQQLITSQQVFLFYDTYTLKDNSVLECVNIPIVITDTNFEFKTTNRNQLFNLVLNYKMAQDYSIQNP
jgi:hypothetical protein